MFVSLNVAIPCLAVEELDEQHPFEGIDLDDFYDDQVAASVESIDINAVGEINLSPMTNDDLALFEDTF